MKRELREYGTHVEYNYSSACSKLLNAREFLNNTKKYKIATYKVIIAQEKELKLLRDFKEILEERLEKVDDEDSIYVINEYIIDTERKIKLFEERLNNDKLLYETCNEDIVYIKKNEVEHFEKLVKKFDTLFKH